MEIEVRYFAAAREAAGCAQERVEMTAGSTVADLAGALRARHPALEEALPGLRFALDEAFVDADAPLSAGTVVALIPPVGGG